MRSTCVATLVACLLAPGGPAVAQVSPGDPPHVRLIATGGTIANWPGNRLTADELVELVPGLDAWVRADTEQFSNLASGALTVRDWLGLSRRINQLLFDQPDLAGVVVSTGTDTLEETAYFLHLTIHSDRPVVLVGAMRSPVEPGYDGAANLLQAFRVAADPASRGRGVLVAMNGEINSARDVTKTHAQRTQAFRSGDHGLLGVVDSDRIVYYRESVRRHTLSSEFRIDAIESLPRVDVILTYQDAPADLIRAAVDLGARGLVLAGAGAGSTSGRQRDGLRYAREKNVIVVMSSRSGAGRVTTRIRGEGDRQLVERLGAGDLAPIKARILLMLALTKTQDAREISRMFDEY